VPTYPWGLFRSSDAGASWQSVWTSAGYPDTHERVDLALSPGFATDGTLLRATISGLVWGRPSGCALELSRDAGVSWTRIDVPAFGMYWGCGQPRLSGTTGQLVGSVQIGGEAGQGIGIWSITSSGASMVAPANTITTAPRGSRDGSLFIGTEDQGILARGQAITASA